jgi:hypothetical protein
LHAKLKEKWIIAKNNPMVKRETDCMVALRQMVADGQVLYQAQRELLEDLENKQKNGVKGKYENIKHIIFLC